MEDQHRLIIVTVNQDMDKDLDRLKQRVFYNQSKAEMLRYLIRLGIEQAGSSNHPQKK